MFKKNHRLYCILVTKMFTQKSLMFPLNTLKVVCFSSVRLRLKILGVQICTLGNYQFILVTKWKILIHLFLKEKMGKLHFENELMIMLW